MGIVLLRVDERLIHGQVTIGWGARLKPSRYVVVDDDLAGSQWERELMALGVPPGVEAVFATVAESRDRVEEWLASDEEIVLLTRDLDHMLRLARSGRLRGTRVNLGGLHHAPGREEVLPYLYLTEQDQKRIRELEREGVEVTARDLPTSPVRSTADILR